MKTTLTEAEWREICDLRQIVNNLAGFNFFNGSNLAHSTKRYEGKPYYWALVRINEILEYTEPKILWTTNPSASWKDATNGILVGRNVGKSTINTTMTVLKSR